MTTGEEVSRVLSERPTKHARILAFGALLARESHSDVLIVGGSAIEVYTRGGYVSGDVDIVGEREKIVPVLERWGFAKPSRLWIRDNWEIAVDIVGKHYTGATNRLRTLSTPYGPVRLAVPEDLLVKRLIEAKHWKQTKALEDAALLYEAERGAFDWEYAEEFAKREDVADLLADFRERVSGASSDVAREA